MIAFIRNAGRSRFGRDALTLVTATAGAQVITLGVSPLLTRLYVPAEFGLFAVFFSIVSIGSIVAGGRYELAVPLPADDADGLALLVLACGIAVATGAVSGAALFLIAAFVRPVGESGWWAVAAWLPLGITVVGINQAFAYWCLRRRRFRALAANRAQRAGFIALLSVVLGVAGFGATGLVAALTVGQLLAAVLLLRSVWADRSIGRGITREHVAALARRYSAFPRLSTLSGLASAATGQMPVYVLATFFGPAVTGLYGLAQRSIAGPLGMIGDSVADVFKQRASEEMNKTGSCRRTWDLTFRGLLLTALPGALVLAAAGPELFAFVFGGDWREAGVYARILSPYFLMAFVASPLTRTLIVAEKQSYDLAWQISLFVVVGLSLLAASATQSPRWVLAAFTASYSFMYLAALVLSQNVSRRLRDSWQPVPGAAR